MNPSWGTTHAGRGKDRKAGKAPKGLLHLPRLSTSLPISGETAGATAGVQSPPIKAMPHLPNRHDTAIRVAIPANRQADGCRKQRRLRATPSEGATPHRAYMFSRLVSFFTCKSWSINRIKTKCREHPCRNIPRSILSGLIRQTVQHFKGTGYVANKTTSRHKY